MEGAEPVPEPEQQREGEPLAESSPARPAAPPSPAAASPHVVLDVMEEHEPVPTSTAHSSVPAPAKPSGKPSPPPPPRTPTAKADATAPPPPPPPTLATNRASTTADSDAKPNGNVLPPPPPPPPNTSTGGNPGDKLATPPTSPPPLPPTCQTAPPTTPTVLNTSHRPQLPASEVPSRSTVNPISHTSTTSSELFEDEDTRLELCAIELTNIEQALEEKVKLAKKLRKDHEIRRRHIEIQLRQLREELDNFEDKIASKEQDLIAAELRDRQKSLNYRDAALNSPLLLQQDQNKKDKDDDVWDKRQNILAISLACGLSVLISMQPLFPPDYLKWIVGSFAVVWALATIAFPAGLFGTYRLEKDFSRHVCRLTFMSFAVFVIYILYILSQSPAAHSSDLTPSPPPQLLELWVPSVDLNAWFYIALGILTLFGHIALWILGCLTGGDKDP